MITAFTVKNFKAIGEEPVRIELKPITLLFGANSAGKSSILHALYYANEVFNNRDLDVGKITLGENNSLDLGGFRRFVYNTDNDKILSIILKFDLNLNFDPIYLGDFSNRLPSKTNPYTLLSNATTGYVEVEISWGHVTRIPYVSRYETGINGERIAIINAIDNGGDGSQVSISHFNIAHHIFSDFWITSGSTLDHLIEKCVRHSCIRRSANQERNNVQGDDEHKTQKSWRIKRRQIFEQLGRVPNSEFTLSSDVDNLDIRLHFQNDALPYNWKHKLSFHNDVWFEVKPLSENIRELLNLILIEPGKQVAEFLKQICYLGPLREIPPRYFYSNNSVVKFTSIQSRRWATGLGAWDTLYSIGQKQLCEAYKSVPSPDDNLKIQRDNHLSCFYPPSDEFDPPLKYLGKENSILKLNTINNWLFSAQRLNTGYEVIIELYREIPSELLSKALTVDQSIADIPELANEILRQPEKIRIWLYDKLRDIKLTPHEIGVGISQVLPVVVAAIGTTAPLVVIEQPELHIHPAVQVQLGDLFITQSSKNKFFLIETHSEHLLLRILRRIRETAEGKAPEEVKLLPNEVAVYYVESENGSTQVNRIGLDENGRFTDRWPKGFFAERMREMLPSDIRERVEAKR